MRMVDGVVYDFHTRMSAEEKRTRLKSMYPQDKGKFNKMKAKQIHVVYKNVMVRRTSG